MYQNDLERDKKFVKSERDIKKYMQIWKTKMFERVGYVSVLGRMTNFYENAGQIDVNGKFYVFSDPVSIPTEIQLNYKNKHKMTRNPSRGLEKEFLITNKMIESLEKY